jgi:hypothetical protein
MSLVAACPGCNKRYKVPHNNKAWRCKVCDVELLVDSDLEPPPLPGKDKNAGGCESGDSCPDCGAPQDTDTHFCGECGADLGGGEQLGKGRKRLERKERGQVLRRAANPIGKLRNILQATAFVVGMYFVVIGIGAIGAWGSSNSSVLLWVAVALGIELTLLIVVIKQLDRRPLPAVLTLAVFRTVFFALTSGVSFVTGLMDGNITFAGVTSLSITVFYWIVTVRVAALSKLLKDNPEMYAARRMRGETKHLQQRGGKTRTRHQARSKTKIPWIAIGSGVVVIALGIGGYQWSEHSNKPEPPPEASLPTAAIAAFKKGWNASDVEELIKDIQPERKVRWRGLFTKAAKRYSLGAEWPKIVGSVITKQSRTRTSIEFMTDSGPLLVNLRWHAYEDWDVYGVDYRQLDIPDQD